MAPVDVHRILDIISNKLRLLVYPENSKFVVQGESMSFESDPYHQSSADGGATRRDCTPAPQSVRQDLLRITMSTKPKDAHLGWIFGCDGLVCDVLLDRDNRRGVSARQFAIRMQKEPGVFIIVNLSKHGTLIKLAGPAFTLVKSQRAFGTAVGMEDMIIRAGDVAMELTCPDHSAHLGDYEVQWSRLYAELGVQLPSLTSLAVSAGPSTTRASVEFYYSGELGRGDGGQVYRAVDRFTGQIYAVKQYWSRKDVRKEAALLSAIQHVSAGQSLQPLASVLAKLSRSYQEHIVKFHSFNEATNELVLEYIQGHTLRGEQTRLRFSMLELKLFTRQTLDASSYLHRNGITHRDLKLDNVVVQNRSPLHIKLIDFNVSSDLELMKTFVGTRRYMAPEISNTHGYDSKADVWSLGIMDLELFCGLPPLNASFGLHPHLAFKGKQHVRAVAFISYSLSEGPARRPTAEAALCLEFLDIERDDATTALPPMDTSAETSYIDTDHGLLPQSGDLPDTWPWEVPYPFETKTDSLVSEIEQGKVSQRRKKRARESPSTHAANESPLLPQRRSTDAPESLTISDLMRSELWAPPTWYGAGDEGQTKPGPAHQQGMGSLRDLRQEEEGGMQMKAEVADSQVEVPAIHRPERLATLDACSECLRHRVLCPLHNLMTTEHFIYIVHHGQRVSMRRRDYSLCATEICKAAQQTPNERRRLLDAIRRRATIDVRYTPGANGKQSWAPFRDGVFLCQFLGLVDPLQTLLCQAPYSLPSIHGNYFIPRESAA